MTSQINPNNIDGNYPVAGVSNNTQGMRDNFTNTKTNFQYAADEITELQQKAILKSAITGTTLDNNMNDNVLYAVQLKDVSYTLINVAATAGTVTLDYAAGMYQQINTTGSISLAFANWPVAGTVGALQIGINITSPAFTVTLPAAVSQGLIGLEGVSPGTPGVSNTITFNQIGNFVFEFITPDAGETIYVFDRSRPRVLYTAAVSIQDETVSTSTATGALVVDGGLGVSGNLYVGGDIVGNIQIAGISLTGNVTGGNLITPGLVTATGNVTGGNVISLGSVTAIGNVTTAGILAQTLSLTGNITSAANVTGNVNAGNLRTSGQLSAAGNVTGGNIRTTGTVSTTGTVVNSAVSTSGNVTGANLVTAGLATVVGNVIAGNVITAGTTTATGNITGGNVVTAGAISALGSITSSGATAGIGYRTGAGGTVTQLTSKSTPVTLNNIAGEITMNAALLGGDATVNFTLNNTAIANTDVIILNQVGGGNIGEYAFNGACNTGNAVISVHNMTNTNRSDAIVIRFAVIKAATS